MTFSPRMSGLTYISVLRCAEEFQVVGSPTLHPFAYPLSIINPCPTIGLALIPLVGRSAARRVV